MCQLYDSRLGVPLTLAALAEKFEVSTATIDRCLKKHGMKAIHNKRKHMSIEELAQKHEASLKRLADR